MKGSLRELFRKQRQNNLVKEFEKTGNIKTDVVEEPDKNFMNPPVEPIEPEEPPKKIRKRKKKKVEQE